MDWFNHGRSLHGRRQTEVHLATKWYDPNSIPPQPVVDQWVERKSAFPFPEASFGFRKSSFESVKSSKLLHSTSGCREEILSILCNLNMSFFFFAEIMRLPRGKGSSLTHPHAPLLQIWAGRMIKSTRRPVELMHEHLEQEKREGASEANQF